MQRHQYWLLPATDSATQVHSAVGVPGGTPPRAAFMAACCAAQSWAVQTLGVTASWVSTLCIRRVCPPSCPVAVRRFRVTG